MTALMICATVSTAPLLGGPVDLFERNKWPTARLRAFVSNRSEVLLWPARTMSLTEKVMIASG